MPRCMFSRSRIVEKQLTSYDYHLLQTHEGLPLVTNQCDNGTFECSTKNVHVFAERWALQPEGYEAVMFENPLLSYASSSLKGMTTRLMKIFKT